MLGRFDAVTLEQVQSLAGETFSGPWAYAAAGAGLPGRGGGGDPRGVDGSAF